jgi:hypothetical protein
MAVGNLEFGVVVELTVAIQRERFIRDLHLCKPVEL